MRKFETMSVVVHLFGSMDRGGAEMRALELLRKRRRAGEHHVFISLSGRKGALDEEIRSLNSEVIARRLSPTFPLWFIAELRRRRPTHLHSHVQLASGYLLPLGWLARVPRRIAHFHSIGDGRANHAGRWAYRTIGLVLVHLFATDIVAVSDVVLRVVTGSRRRGPARSAVLYDRVDGARFAVERVEEVGYLRLGVVGRLDAEKNPQRCLEIVAALQHRSVGKQLAAWFAGTGSEAELADLRHRAARLGLFQIVQFLGVRDDIPALLARTDLLLSTTESEGLPGAVIEAAAAGVPAVVSAIGPNEEAARWLPSVVPVPLDAADDVWCNVIEDVLADRTGRFSASTIQASFDRSPFAYSDHQPELDALWS